MGAYITYIYDGTNDHDTSASASAVDLDIMSHRRFLCSVQ